MKYLFYILIVLIIVFIGIIAVISFFFELVHELFTGAGIYGIITVAGILLFIVSIISIIKS